MSEAQFLEPLIKATSPLSRRSSFDAGEIKQEGNKLKLFNGVVIPCMLHILGVLVFLKVSWTVGQAGWLGTLVMFFIGESLSITTSLSLSALCTNGRMAGGGAYYMISRSLGPEFGGAMGVLFYIAYTCGAAFHLSGFVSEISTSFNIPEEYHFYVATGGLLLVFIISFSLSLQAPKAGFYGKINGILWVLQLLTIWISIGCMWFRQPMTLEHGGTYTGMSFETFKSNFWPNLTEGNNFQSVFALIFPAMTGIMEGANLSGDLENPGRDLGRGTLYAVFAAIFHYVVLFTSLAFCFPHDTLISDDYIVMQEIGFHPSIVLIGVIIVSISAGLGSFIGGSRVLQAMARDNIFPFLRIFAKGYGKGNEPRVAVVFTFILCEICLFIGSLEMYTLAPFMTNFFCISYGLVNLSCLILRMNGAPNFRPRFKGYNIYTCILGVILNFVNDPKDYDSRKALISFGLLILVYLYLYFTCPQQEWGDIGQALTYHNLRKSLLRLDETRDHPKFWRPSILLWYPAPNIAPLVDLCNILKKGGLYILGDIHIDNKTIMILNESKNMANAAANPTEDQKESSATTPLTLDHLTKPISRTDLVESIVKDKEFYDDLVIDGHVFKEEEEGLNMNNYKYFIDHLIEHYSLKAFPYVTYANSFLSGFKNLIVSAGIGALSPNTIILPLLTGYHPFEEVKATDYYQYIKEANPNYALSEFERPSTPYPTNYQYTAVVREALSLQKIVCLARNYEKLAVSSCNMKWEGVLEEKKPKGLIDLYIEGDWKWDKEFEDYLSIILQYAYILHRNVHWSNHTIRLIQLFDSTKIYPRGRRQKVDIEQKLRDLLNEVRIDAEPIVVEVETYAYNGKEIPFVELPDKIRYQYLNSIIREKSKDSHMIFYPLPLPMLKTNIEDDSAYIENILELTNDLPPILLFNSTKHVPIITRFI